MKEYHSWLKNNLTFTSHNSDVSDRDTALDVVRELFGEENVIAVSNFNTLKIPSLLKDLARLENIPFQDINQYTSRIEDETVTGAQTEFGSGFDKQMYVLTIEEAEKHSDSYKKVLELYPQLREPMRNLFKQKKSISRHAGGCVITENAVDNIPIIKSGKVLQTPWSEGINFRHLEPMGFLKFDILGLGTLRMIEGCIQKILIREGNPTPKFSDVKKWYDSNLSTYVNKMDDQKVYRHVYWEGRFPAIFQFVEQGVQQFIKRMKPTSITDLAVATSIYRPGPLGISADKLYLDNRNNPQKAFKGLPHALMESVIKDTGYLPVFQEQIQQLVNVLSGVPIDKTDDVRKALMKKDISNKEKTEKDRQVLKEKFIVDCKAANNIPEKVSSDIFDMLLKFVSYSFNKAHASAYAINSYMCAWLFTYYPAEWLCSYLDYTMDDPDKKHKAMKEVKQLGWSVEQADINYSDIGWAVAYNKTNQYGNPYLISSFASIKGIGEAAVAEIKANRPYKTLEDLLFDSNPNAETVWKHSKFNKKALGALIQVGGFKSMDLVGKEKTFKNYQHMYKVLVENGDIVKKASARKKNRNHQELLTQLIQEHSSTPDYSPDEKLKISETLLGAADYSILISDKAKEFFLKKDYRAVDDIEEGEKHENTYWCIVTSVEEKQTQKGTWYLQLKVVCSSKEHSLRIWNYNPNKTDVVISKNSVLVGTFEYDPKWGLATQVGKVREIKLLSKTTSTLPTEESKTEK